MDELTRREFTAITAATLAGGCVTADLIAADGTETTGSVHCSIVVNGQKHEIVCDARVTLLDLLRERLHLTGTKKGCDHGQCGACTVIVNGTRVISCLTLTAANDGAEITTIEGLATADALHPLQAAFIEYDGFQCGFCTSGQICSGVAMLREWESGVPSAVTAPSPGATRQALSEDEIRERMAGNICRCGAYPNIVAAIQAVERNAAKEGHA